MLLLMTHGDCQINDKHDIHITFNEQQNSG